MTNALSPIGYPAPQCFTSPDGLHFSPLGMEISGMFGGSFVALAPIGEGAADELERSLTALVDDPDFGTGLLPKPDRNLMDRVAVTCSALEKMADAMSIDRSAWELHLLRHGMDDWPPAIQTMREDVLSALADQPDGSHGGPAAGTLMWQHVIMRCMGGRGPQIITDKEFFQTGVPYVCPDSNLLGWGDLTAQRKSRGMSIA